MDVLVKQWENIRNNFYFANPEYLQGFYIAAFLAVTALVVLVIWLYNRPGKTHGSNYSILGPVRFWFMMTVFFLLGVTALARPCISKNGLTIVRGPVEVIILVGTSFSEFAQDWGRWQPSRMELAKREVLNLFSSDVFIAGDKAAFYVFANASKKLIPLVDIQKHSDKFISQISSKLIPPETILEREFYLGSSDIVVALEDIYQTLDRHDLILQGNLEPEKTLSSTNWRPSRRENRLALVFSDGDFELDHKTTKDQKEAEIIQEYRKRLELALGEFRKRGIRIYTVGIGTQRGVRLNDILKRYKLTVDYSMQDEQDLKEKGLTKVNPSYLQFLTLSTGGYARTDFFLVNDVNDNTLDFMRRSINSSRSVAFKPISKEGNQELWQFFLIAAVLVFGFGWLIK